MNDKVWVILGKLLLAVLLGVVGQLARVVVGLMKENDQADAANQQLFPLLGRKQRPSTSQYIEHIALGELNFPQCGNPKWAATIFLRNGGVVRQFDLGVKTTC